MTREALVQLVLDAVEWDMMPTTLFSEADAAGHDLAALLDILMRPADHLAAEETLLVESSYTDPVMALLAHAGLERATQIARRARSCDGVDVARRHAQLLAARRIDEALHARSPVLEVYTLIGDAGADRSRLLAALGRTYPPTEVAALVPHLLERDLPDLGNELRRRISALEAIPELLDQVEDGLLLSALRALWSVDVAADDTVVSVWARLASQTSRPLGPVARRAAERGGAETWVPVLRSAGLKSSHAALILHERGAGPAEIAGDLQRGGHSDDDVLTALLENGIGPRRSLELLRAEGFSLDRMVESLHRRGVLLPEVRSHLDDLGVDRLTQSQLALRCWDRATVALVLGIVPRLPANAG